jgi:hypothetical protein
MLIVQLMRRMEALESTVDALQSELAQLKQQQQQQSHDSSPSNTQTTHTPTQTTSNSNTSNTNSSHNSNSTSSTSPSSANANANAHPLPADKSQMTLANVLAHYHSILRSIFRHYCFCAFPGKSHFALDKRGASKFTRDCHLTALFPEDITCEILFTRVLKLRQSRSIAADMPKLAALPSSCDELTFFEFTVLLTQIAEVASLADASVKSAAQRLLSLMRAHILPFAERESAQLTLSALPFQAPIVLDEECEIVLRNAKPMLEKVFVRYAWKYPANGRDPRVKKQRKAPFPLSYTAFVEMLQKLELFNLVSRVVVRTLFFAQVDAEELEACEANPQQVPEVMFSGFAQCVAQLGLIAYAQPMFAAQYDTLAKRLQKMMARMESLAAGSDPIDALQFLA